MERVPTLSIEKSDKTQELYTSLGNALEGGDTEAAMILLGELKEALEAGLTSESAQRTVSEQIPADSESPESLGVTELVENIYNFAGVEITIFGTGHGLQAPLSITMDGSGGYSQNHKDREEALKYERGRNKEKLNVGLHVYKDGEHVVAELVQESRDAFNRFGFKGIQVTFPIDDAGLANSAVENKAVLTEAMRLIWEQLGDLVNPRGDKDFFTVS